MIADTHEGRTRRRAIAVAALALAATLTWAALAGSASAATPRAVVGSLAGLPHGSRVLGALSASRSINLTVSLQPRDAAALARYASAVSTPGNRDYGHTLSVAQFATRFGAPNGHIAAVRRTLRKDGLTLGRLDRNDLTLAVSGRVSAVERAFGVSLFAVRSDDRDAYANRAEPTLPRSIAGDVQAVYGLDDVALLQSVGLQRKAHVRALRAGSPHADLRSATPTSGPEPCGGAEDEQQAGGLTADEIASIYQFPALYAGNDSGAGQTIGLIEIEPFHPNDITTYDECYGISAPPISTVTVPPGPTATTDDGESALDIEIVQGMAPGASLDVYEGGAAVVDAPATWSAAISADSAKVISASLGACELGAAATVAPTENTLFEEAATQGQTILASSGDQGSAACDGSGTNPALAVNDPASQPYVTGVGGTTVFTGSNADPGYWNPGDPVLQGVWNDGTGSGMVSGTGGGISTLWAMPSYQSTAAAALGVLNGNSSGAACHATAGDCREVPDVSANADPNTGYVVFENGGEGSEWSVVGGTSAAAPLWASWLALTNDLPACKGLTVGFANPLLYTIADSSYASNFTAITNPSPFTEAASNDAVGTNGGLYPITGAYSMATGLGSMTSALANAVCAARAAGFAVAVASPGTQSGGVGTPVSLQISGSDTGDLPLSYSATGLPAGLAISASGAITGTPTIAQTTTVTVTARDGDGYTGSATFTFSVSSAAGPPAPKPVVEIHNVNVSGVKLSGLIKRKPKLSFTLSAGKGKPALKLVSVSLPTGLGFASNTKTLGRAIKLSGGRSLRFSVKHKHGVLTVTLKKASSRLSATISTPGLTITKREASKIKRRKLKSVTIKLKVTNAQKQASSFSEKLAKLS